MRHPTHNRVYLTFNNERCPFYNLSSAAGLIDLLPADDLQSHQRHYTIVLCGSCLHQTEQTPPCYLPAAAGLSASLATICSCTIITVIATSFFLSFLFFFFLGGGLYNLECKAVFVSLSVKRCFCPLLKNGDCVPWMQNGFFER